MIKGRAQLTIGSSSWLRNTLKSVMLCLRNESFRSSIWRPEFTGTSFWRFLDERNHYVIGDEYAMCNKNNIFFLLILPQTKAFVKYFRLERLLSLSRFGRTYMMWRYPDVNYYCYFWLLFFELLPKGRPPWRLGVFGSVPAQSFPYQVHKKFEKNPRLKWCIIQFQGSTCKVIAK